MWEVSIGLIYRMPINYIFVLITVFSLIAFPYVSRMDIAKKIFPPLGGKPLGSEHNRIDNRQKI